MATARNSAGGVLLPDRNTFVVSGGYGTGGHLSSCEKLNTSNTWSSTANLSLGVRSTHAAVLFNDKVIVLGGYTGIAFLNTTEQYDHEANLWTAFPSFLTVRGGLGAAVVRSVKFT